jgi:hypothetical protein
VWGFALSFVATKLREDKRGEERRPERRRGEKIDKDRKRNQCVCVVQLLFVKTRHD